MQNLEGDGPTPQPMPRAQNSETPSHSRWVKEHSLFNLALESTIKKVYKLPGKRILWIYEQELSDPIRETLFDRLMEPWGASGNLFMTEQRISTLEKLTKQEISPKTKKKELQNELDKLQTRLPKLEELCDQETWARENVGELDNKWARAQEWDNNWAKEQKLWKEEPAPNLPARLMQFFRRTTR